MAFVFLLTQLTNTSPPYNYTVNTSPPLLRILIRLTLIIVVNAIAIYIYGFILIRLEAVIRLVLSINTIRIPKRFTKVGNRIPKRLQRDRNPYTHTVTENAILDNIQVIP